MRAGAVVVAAGMSSRMGKFKPMLNVGSISIAQRVISTLQQAGVGRIVVVTGYQAEELERHLAKKGVVFLRNEAYEHTEMFDSAKIGLDYLKNKCNRILFTPVDIPLFTSDTVSKLLASQEKLVVPVHEGVTGHPILLDASLVDSILEDTGDCGLQGAFHRLEIPMTFVPVDDSGTVQDVDTPRDFQKLLELHNRQLMRPVVSFALAREKIFLDERMVMLLQLVEETGSVRKACMRMQISYTTGWNLLHKLESQLSKPLVVRSQGGANGGESRLTEDGKTLLLRYQQVLQELRQYAGDLYRKYFEGLFE